MVPAILSNFPLVHRPNLWKRAKAGFRIVWQSFKGGLPFRNLESGNTDTNIFVFLKLHPRLLVRIQVNCFWFLLILDLLACAVAFLTFFLLLLFFFFLYSQYCNHILVQFLLQWLVLLTNSVLLTILCSCFFLSKFFQYKGRWLFYQHLPLLCLVERWSRKSFIRLWFILYAWPSEVIWK